MKVPPLGERMVWPFGRAGKFLFREAIQVPLLAPGRS